jgi:hypothetical protein
MPFSCYFSNVKIEQESASIKLQERRGTHVSLLVLEMGSLREGVAVICGMIAY